MGYARIQFNAPDVNRVFRQGNFSYGSKDVIDANIDMLRSVAKRFDSLMDKWGEEFDIPNYVINAFICTESGGRNVGANNFWAIGLMQVTAPTVYETITKWDVMVDVPLNTALKATLSKFVPSWKSWDRNKTMSSTFRSQINSALTKEEFNVAIGCAVLRWMLEAFARDGESNINKTMVAYNSGFYGARTKMRGLTTTEQLLNKKGLGAEPKAYLLKMLGVNGFLDLWYKHIKK